MAARAALPAGENYNNSDDDRQVGANRQFQFTECTDLRTCVKRAGSGWLDRRAHPCPTRSSSRATRRSASSCPARWGRDRAGEHSQALHQNLAGRIAETVDDAIRMLPQIPALDRRAAAAFRATVLLGANGEKILGGAPFPSQQGSRLKFHLQSLRQQSQSRGKRISALFEHR
jgi:hypothetical protein